MKEILIINGHPNKNSFNSALVEAYKKGALQSNSQVNEIIIADLDFNPNLEYGYKKKMPLEPDLLEAKEKIAAANHLVWIHPVWWGGFPAILKGFIDRLFLPGFAFRYKEDSIWWEKLLKGKTARIITTIDQPAWYYRFYYGSPSVKSLKKSILQFCGVNPVSVNYIGSIKSSDQKQREKWVDQVYQLGVNQK
ncbi:NAD(P)H-dependent oxidoreductase [Aliifodinibius salicampi]|uniref:NAD(P)H-dependent oxidoreductase n=1 Tax=Fodinibius salicampi TaxID=1920655 RepID=A0ABT3Q1A3_9BACT|nr:NAD(P)H-dependent oxidoreductase [Fodinibius salicampi]MCW9713890.1 NAD(P)H-dependent oxidoreductase [Fodinibius salicampi]